MTKKSTLQVVPKHEKSAEAQNGMPVRAASPFEELDRMMESFFPSGWMRPPLFDRPPGRQLATRFDMKMPAVDVIDRDDEVVVRAEIPGIDKKDLDISVTDNTVALPGNVDGARAKAVFKDGMLELALPKLEKSKRHTVSVE